MTDIIPIRIEFIEHRKRSFYLTFTFTTLVSRIVFSIIIELLLTPLCIAGIGNKKEFPRQLLITAIRVQLLL